MTSLLVGQTRPIGGPTPQRAVLHQAGFAPASKALLYLEAILRVLTALFVTVVNTANVSCGVVVIGDWGGGMAGVVHICWISSRPRFPGCRVVHMCWI